MAETSISGETMPREPFVMKWVKLDSTHPDKNETKALLFFKKWVKLARTWTSKLHTIESKDRTLNFHQYLLALEGVEHFHREKNNVGIQVCSICVCEVDKNDAKFFCKTNSSESIDTSADWMVHDLHGHWLDEGLKRGMKPFESFKCRQERFYLQYYCTFFLLLLSIPPFCWFK